MSTTDTPRPDTPSEPQVVLVTGATGGIGSAIVRRMVREGRRAAIHHLGDSDAALSLADEVADGHPGGRPAVVEGDVADPREVAGFVADVERQLGATVGVLVNNAGVMFERPLSEFGDDEWNRVIDTNLTGTYNVTNAVLPLLEASGDGVVINVASQLAFKGASGLTAYCASKGGVVGFSRALAREVGPAIRVYALAPGPIETPMIEPYATDEWVRERTGSLIAGRLGLPEEVAGICHFLCSDDARLLQGQVLHCNGGGYLA